MIFVPGICWRAGVGFVVMAEQPAYGDVCPDKLGELYHGDWVVTFRQTRIRRLAAQIDFSTGFADTLKWYKEHGWLPEGTGNSGRSRQEGAVCP